MKRQIITFILGAAVFGANPAFAMDTNNEVDGKSIPVTIPSTNPSESEAEEFLETLDSLQLALQEGKNRKLIEQTKPYWGVEIDYTHRSN
ncbi:MAG TPA: hypothetical protein VMW10_07130 [Alphaproteobacteria bacterium]|nr:hypothetical protein [Alphaproteobacteria bacterium]